MSFEDVVRGKLSLKGKALPAIGVKKKKKAKKTSASLESFQKQALKDAEAALKEEEARGGVAGVHESGEGDDEDGEKPGHEEDYRTPAEKR